MYNRYRLTHCGSKWWIIYLGKNWRWVEVYPAFHSGYREVGRVQNNGKKKRWWLQGGGVGGPGLRCMHAYPKIKFSKTKIQNMAWFSGTHQQKCPHINQTPAIRFYWRQYSKLPCMCAYIFSLHDNERPLLTVIYFLQHFKTFSFCQRVMWKARSSVMLCCSHKILLQMAPLLSCSTQLPAPWKQCSLWGTWEKVSSVHVLCLLCMHRELPTTNLYIFKLHAHATHGTVALASSSTNSFVSP